MYIFPTLHYTEPVLGKDDYRYSISCNFIIFNPKIYDKYNGER